MKFTILECTVQMYIQFKCNQHLDLVPKYLHPPKRSPSTHQQSLPMPRLPSAPGNYQSAFCLKISCKRNQTVRLFVPIFSTPGGMFLRFIHVEACVFHSILRLNNILLHGPRFVYPFASCWTRVVSSYWLLCCTYLCTSI